MNIIEAVKSGRKFRLKGHNRNEKALALTRDAILSNDWEVEHEGEEWYEGDFKKKHPNGVLCKVNASTYRDEDTEIAAVVKYKKGHYDYPFKTLSDNWKYAKPISYKNAPAIIGKDK